MSENPEDVQVYNLTYSLDRHEFFRRSCPSCGLHFKTKADPGDISSLLQPIFKRAGLEIGGSLNEGNNLTNSISTLVCPYCGQTNEISSFLTPEFQRYLERFVMREFVLPKLHNMLSDFAGDFPNTPSRSGGLFSIEVSINYERALLPPRPISGPEPPDMKILDLVCCLKTIKILDKWNFPINCPYCGEKAVMP